MNATHIRIGTRGSALALWQARHVAGLLELGGFTTEIVCIDTKGDQLLDRSLSKIGSKGVFTAELETALYHGHIDIAVHSAKDLPSDLPEGLELIAFTEREQVNDVLVSLNPDVAPDTGRPWVIGTSSTRRVALLRHYYPHLQATDMRGNLQTRMRKLQDGLCDALLLAYAGVHRMEFDQHVVAMLPTHFFTPAAGQGSVALEAATTLGTEKRAHIRHCVNHPSTENCLLAERAFLHRLQGGCSIPSFALAQVDAGGTLSVQAGIISLNGQQMVRQSLSGPVAEAEALGHRLGDAVLAAGGAAILCHIREQQAGEG